jgi:CRISPR-associated endoribonuclease Cas6
MRLKLKFKSENPALTIPCHYNELIQGFIYKHLDDWLATNIHDSGFKDPSSKRQLKLFTFSRLISGEKVKVEKRKITFKGPLSLVISSPYHEFIQSFGSNLLKKGTFHIDGQSLELISVEVEPVPSYRENVIVKTLSPITVYSTLLTPDNRKKTYYYNPFEADFEELLIKNLQRKVRTWTGTEPAGGSIKPYRVNPKNERIIIYKDTVIKAWDGLYELQLPPELFQMAFDAGLGAKNSQGFGCIDLWNEKTNEHEKFSSQK